MAAGTFTLAVKVLASTGWGTQIVDVAGVTSGTSDPNLSNNSATQRLRLPCRLWRTTQSQTLRLRPRSLAGSNITYTQVVTNNGPAASPNTSVTESLPANTSFVSATGPTGWACSLITTTTPNTINCSETTAPALPSGNTATITVVVTVIAGTANGTIITNTASVVSGVEDPNTGNNNATANVTVASATQADLSVTSTASPNPVTDGNNISYTQIVTNNGPAATTTGNATFTDTIPTNTTFVSFTVPTGWNCGTLPAVGATGTISCTNTASFAANTTASFPLVVKVNQGVSPGTPAFPTTILNTANINIPCSAATDPICTNNTAQTKVYIASGTEADVAITKTASPEPVNQGTNLTYTLQVTNNGPAVAQGVTVSDNPLPPEVSYVSVSTTQGSCTYTVATTSVGCNLGSISVGGLAIVTINVTANTFSSSTQSTNTATVSATTSDPNSTNNSSSSISTILSPTAVQLASFRAMPRQGGGVLLEWKTREEIRNLGFNVYRLDGSGRLRLNPSIIAGSALLIRGGKPQHAAKTYQWIDPSGTPQSTYELEDVDLNGTRMPHGPVSVDVSATPRSGAVSQPLLLTQLNRATTQPAFIATPRATQAIARDSNSRARPSPHIARRGRSRKNFCPKRRLVSSLESPARRRGP